MSVTTTINPPAKGNSGESKKKFATYATTSAAAVMTGVASSKIISEFGGDNGENEDTGIEQTNSQSENCGASVQDVSGAERNRVETGENNGFPAPLSLTTHRLK